LLKTVLFFAKFSKIKNAYKMHINRQKHPNSTFCSHLILLEKGLEDALEPAEARYSGAFLMAGVTRLELAASGVTGRRSNQLSYTPNIIGV
jgi:hypothetical protein